MEFYCYGVHFSVGEFKNGFAISDGSFATEMETSGLTQTFKLQKDIKLVITVSCGYILLKVVLRAHLVEIHDKK